MATTYKTPGVYVEEISIFPPSVAQVETAIPAFIGYTQSAVIDGVDFHSDSIIKPIKIGSLKEYEFNFGGAPNPTTIEVELKTDNSVKTAVVNGEFLIYDSLRMFFANGGGDCFIVSVGSYDSDPFVSAKIASTKDALLNGLASLEKEDLPTLLVIPESVHLSEEGAGQVHVAMLAQCNKLQDRFSVMDIVNGDKETGNPVLKFRNNVGMNYLKYGAAYYPWIKTTLPFKVDYDTIVNGTYKKGANLAFPVKTVFNSTLVEIIDHLADDINAKTEPTPLESITTRPQLILQSTVIYQRFQTFNDLTFQDSDLNDTKSAASLHAKVIAPDTAFHKLVKLFYEYVYFSDAANGSVPAGPPWDSPILTLADFGTDFPDYTFAAPTTTVNDIYTTTSTALNAAPYFVALYDKLNALINSFYAELAATRKARTETLLQIDPVYAGVMAAVLQKGVVLPPSGAVVGIYAAVDENRGVWKAPANVSISAVKGPAVNITSEDQESLNIDTEAGKSVNAIRAFTGKGTLIWGARTLAGNDNEWRYISVRRFFNMVEESVKKATGVFVFEPNDANTWVKVKAMIDNFLNKQWKAGALAGPTPDKAYFVKVGLGETMTAQDILEGYMIVEIGMAAVRPAEFIVLKFSHKMQEA
ncbi:MAG: phage tail sheath family protein [Draconibacterium sp.]